MGWKVEGAREALTCSTSRERTQDMWQVLADIPGRRREEGGGGARCFAPHTQRSLCNTMVSCVKCFISGTVMQTKQENKGATEGGPSTPASLRIRRASPAPLCVLCAWYKASYRVREVNVQAAACPTSGCACRALCRSAAAPSCAGSLSCADRGACTARPWPR